MEVIDGLTKQLRELKAGETVQYRDGTVLKMLPNGSLMHANRSRQEKLNKKQRVKLRRLAQTERL
jgi:hypothetical protein